MPFDVSHNHSRLSGGFHLGRLSPQQYYIGHNQHGIFIRQNTALAYEHAHAYAHAFGTFLSEREKKLTWSHPDRCRESTRVWAVEMGKAETPEQISIGCQIYGVKFARTRSLAPAIVSIRLSLLGRSWASCLDRRVLGCDSKLPNRVVVPQIPRCGSLFEGRTHRKSFLIKHGLRVLTWHADGVAVPIMVAQFVNTLTVIRWQVMAVHLVCVGRSKRGPKK